MFFGLVDRKTIIAHDSFVEFTKNLKNVWLKRTNCFNLKDKIGQHNTISKITNKTFIALTIIKKVLNISIMWFFSIVNNTSTIYVRARLKNEANEYVKAMQFSSEENLE